MTTVIIPAYNAEEYLATAIESLLAQTSRDWNCIIVDDGSVDHTADVAQRYANRDPRIDLVQLHSNTGLSCVRNTAVRFSSVQDYVCFLDSDDAFTPDRIRHGDEALKATGLPFIQCGMITTTRKRYGCPASGRFDANDPRIFTNYKFDPGHAGSKTYRREFIRKFLFPDCALIEDWCVNIQAIAEAGWIYYTGVCDYIYTVRQGSLCHRTVPMETALHTMATVDEILAGIPYDRMVPAQKERARAFAVRAVERRLDGQKLPLR